MVKKSKNNVIVKKAIYDAVKKQGGNKRQISADAVKLIQDELSNNLNCMVDKTLKFVKNADRKKISKQDIQLYQQFPCK